MTGTQTEMETVEVNCTNCGNTTEVPEKHESAFKDGNDGLCEDCAENQEMPEPNTTEMNARDEIIRDMRGEYRERQREKIGNGAPRVEPNRHNNMVERHHRRNL